MEITLEMRNELRHPLPSEAVTKHPTKTYLSSIKAIYVTERLNDVFGVGSWQIKVNHVTTTENSMIVVKVEFSIPKYDVYFESFGGNDNGGKNSKNFDLGDAYKGATTDALTKICSFLEIGIDVFKGKTNNTSNPQINTENKKQEPEKWLNVLDKDKNFTKEWTNIIDGIASKKIVSVADVRKYYKVSKEVEAKITEQLNK